jgi:hypothetical protein
MNTLQILNDKEVTTPFPFLSHELQYDFMRKTVHMAKPLDTNDQTYMITVEIPIYQPLLSL